MDETNLNQGIQTSPEPIVSNPTPPPPPPEPVRSNKKIIIFVVAGFLVFGAIAFGAFGIASLNKKPTSPPPPTQFRLTLPPPPIQPPPGKPISIIKMGSHLDILSTGKSQATC